MTKKGAKGRPKGGQGAKKDSRNYRRDRGWSIVGALGLPTGSKILEKAALLAADCRLEGLEDWR